MEETLFPNIMKTETFNRLVGIDQHINEIRCPLLSEKRGDMLCLNY